jgi:hypothetical protein
VTRRSSNGSTPTIVSATTASSGVLCGTIRIATDVGPAEVEWIAGGRTTTSMTSRDPPNSVTFGLVTVVHAAVNPAGVTT